VLPDFNRKSLFRDASPSLGKLIPWAGDQIIPSATQLMRLFLLDGYLSSSMTIFGGIIRETLHTYLVVGRGEKVTKKD
jgi:hypothetical protein